MVLTAVRPQLLVLVIVGLLVGCGGDDGGGGDTGGGGGGGTSEGATVFAEAGCGSCHTYEAAGSNGSVGPNLDDSNATFEQAVEQITNGGGGMPAFKGDLTQQEIDAVARFVTEGGGGSSSGDGGGGSAVGPFSP
jgi:mono/diheme cytochrome c family protein